MRFKLFILISTFVLCKISFAQKDSLADEPLAFTGALIYTAPGEAPIHDGVVVVWLMNNLNREQML